MAAISEDPERIVRFMKEVDAHAEAIEFERLMAGEELSEDELVDHLKIVMLSLALPRGDQEWKATDRLRFFSSLDELRAKYPETWEAAAIEPLIPDA